MAASFDHLGEVTGNAKAKVLGKTLDAATGKFLDEDKSPSRKVGELKLALERAVEAGEIAPQQETDAYVEFLRANGERFGLDR